jgi:hypothetical protein
MDATSNIATDLFFKIRSRFSKLKLGNETGEITIIPEDARFFDFDYVEELDPIGHISISLAEPNSLKVYFSHAITENMDKRQKSRWYNFLREMRMFAKRRLMAFDTRDIAKDNLDRRDFEFLTRASQPKQDKDKITNPVEGLQKKFKGTSMNESAMYGTKTVSYQKLMDTRLIIKHNKTLADDQQPGARSRNINALFIENQDGERFKYPFLHLAGARAMQRHVANGGLPYDKVGESIVQMSEEIAHLKNFSNYVVRNDLMNSSTNSIIERSIDQLSQLREQIKRLSKQPYYEEYRDNFQELQQSEVPDEIVEEFTEKFTVKNFKEDIKQVFPVLYRLMQENNDQVTYEDIVAMTEIKEEQPEQQISTSSNLFAQFENWVSRLGESGALQSDDPQEQKAAIKQLKELSKTPLPLGQDGINAIESLKKIINDTQLFNSFKQLAREDSEQDARPIIKSWMEENMPNLFNKHNVDNRKQQSLESDHLSRKSTNIQQLAEFIHSFYDQQSGTFPKGPEGVCIMVGKKFGEQAENVARKFVERMAPQQRINQDPKLSGVQHAYQESSTTKENADSYQSTLFWNTPDVQEIDIMGHTFYVKDTPAGRLLLGEDVKGQWYADRNGKEIEHYIGFIVNIDTRKILEYPKDSPGYGYMDDQAVEDYIRDVAAQARAKLGNKKESSVPELEDIKQLAGLATGEKIDRNAPGVQEIDIMDDTFYVKDTSEGRLLLGDDIKGYWHTDQEGNERESYISFVVNLDTGKTLKYPEDHDQNYGYLDDTAVSQFIKNVVNQARAKLGNKKESSVPELEDIKQLAGLK